MPSYYTNCLLFILIYGGRITNHSQLVVGANCAIDCISDVALDNGSERTRFLLHIVASVAE